jgi:hypothetical protein
LLEAFFAILVVKGALLRVGEDFVGFGEVFEFLGCVRVVGVLVLGRELVDRRNH